MVVQKGSTEKGIKLKNEGRGPEKALCLAIYSFHPSSFRPSGNLERCFPAPE